MFDRAGGILKYGKKQQVEQARCIRSAGTLSPAGASEIHTTTTAQTGKTRDNSNRIGDGNRDSFDSDSVSKSTISEAGAGDSSRSGIPAQTKTAVVDAAEEMSSERSRHISGVDLIESDWSKVKRSKSDLKSGATGFADGSVSSAVLPPAMVALAQLSLRLPPESQRYVASDGQFAVVVTKGIDYAIAEDGIVLEFSPATEAELISTGQGVNCPALASNDKFTIARLTDEAFLVKRSDGRESTLKTIGDLASIDSSGSSENSFSAEEVLGQQIPELKTSATVFVSQDKQAAMYVDPESDSHTLVLPDGTSTSFMPSKKNLELVTSVGATCGLVAHGDGIAVGGLTPDAYVVQWTKEGKDSFVETTLFNRIVPGSTESVISIAQTGGAVAGSGSSLQATPTSSRRSTGTSGTSSAATFASSTAGSISSDVASQKVGVDASANLAGNGTVSDAVGTPVWAMSMAERRAHRRQSVL
ncbi:MAG: hypothetical protein WCN95_03235 [bacterium]